MIQNTVFISYRRTHMYFALAIYQNLTARGYDVFFDYETINSGDFEQAILNNIASRAHFLALLTPTALDRVHEPNDWFRREIEYAIETQRNIIPITMEAFKWENANKYLTDGLAPLKRYNALSVPSAYFNEAMDRLCNRYLNVPLDAVIHPRTEVAEKASEKAQAEAQKEDSIQVAPLEEWIKAWDLFELAFTQQDSGDLQSSLDNFTKSIQLNPHEAQAYNNRGAIYHEMGNYDLALRDYHQSIELNPNFADAHYNEGLLHHEMGNYDLALQSYDRAIALNPEDADSFHNRALTYVDLEEYDRAIKDFDTTLQLEPDTIDAYINRGVTHQQMGNYALAIKDFIKAIDLNPSHAIAYNNRAYAFYEIQEHQQALVDVSKALDLEPDHADFLHTRGLIFMALGQIKSAIEDFEKATHIDPDLQDAKDDLVKARAMLDA